MPAVLSIEVDHQVQLSVTVEISCPDDVKMRLVDKSVSRVQHLHSAVVSENHLGIGEVRMFGLEG